MSEKVLREGENVVVIEGIVTEVRIEEGSYKKDGKDVEKIQGEIDIKVNDDVHTVSVYANKINKQGKESGLYKGIQTIKNEFKSIQTHGEEADKVRIETGKVGLNEYVGQDLTIKAFPQISANFINRLKAGDVFEPKAKFTLEMCVANVAFEKKNDEETGRVILKGYVVGYEGKVFPFETVVEGDRAADYVSNNYDKGTTVTVYGEIVNNTTVTKKAVEVGFGAPQEQINRKTIREYKVISGTEPKEEDNEKTYDPKLIKKGLNEREERHKEMIEKKKNAGNGNKSSKDSKNPFADDGKPININEDDLPF
ncbi:hypothetical protein ACFQZE_06810 [Paenibacillus sp. GCM10027627]|uniref:hypothetical protein n=1 Tax=unclassified Paenibacillus TaxID=185978 RepID=UPI003641C289